MRTLRVQHLRLEAPDIRSIILVPVDGRPLAAFTPGSHIDVRVAPGLVRQYSLCNGPAERSHYHIAVKREPSSRGGSRLLHEQLREGDLLQASEPKNNFTLHEGAEPALLVAAGIGITPLLSMARHLAAQGREFELLYFTRGPRQTAFHDLLCAAPFQDRVSLHYALEPQAVQGYLRKRLWHRAPGCQLYLCGPKPFMDLVERTAAATWPPDSVHVEYFGADPQALAGEKRSFLVKLARSGGTIEVEPQETLVVALARQGIVVETSCEQGVCGTCVTGVLAGTPDHRDVFFTDEERAANDRICACVSRSLTPTLVLDL